MNQTNQLILDGAPSFVITRMSARQHPGLGMDIGVVDVTIITPNKLFQRLKNKGDLGSLFLDVSNGIYSQNRNIPAHCPTVDYYQRASKGIKTIHLSYAVRDLAKCKALGLECHEFKSSWAVKYGAYVDLMAPRPKAKLSLVRDAAVAE